MDYYSQIASLKEVKKGYEDDLTKAYAEADGYAQEISKIDECKETLVGGYIVDEYDEVIKTLDDLSYSYAEKRNYILESVTPDLMRKISAIDDMIEDLEAKAAAAAATADDLGGLGLDTPTKIGGYCGGDSVK